MHLSELIIAKPRNEEVQHPTFACTSVPIKQAITPEQLTVACLYLLSRYSHQSEVSCALSTTTTLHRYHVELEHFFDKSIDELIVNIQKPATTAPITTPIDLLVIGGYSNLSDCCILYDPRSQTIVCEYTSTRFDKIAITELLSQLVHLLDQLVTQPQIAFNALTLFVNPKQFSVDPTFTEQATQPLISYFYQAVTQHPDKIATHFKELQWTFSQLAYEVNYLAAQLDKTISSGEVVACYLTRSHWSQVALLAIMHRNAVYLPLDPTYPAAHIQYLIERTQPSVILSEKVHTAQLEQLQSEHKYQVLLVDDPKIEDIDLVEPILDRSFIEPFALLPTSGSTGRAKIIVHHQASFIHRFQWLWQLAPLHEDDVFAQRTTLNFGPHIWELLGGILQGVTSVIIPDEALVSPLLLAELIKTHQITRFSLVPSLIRTLLETKEQIIPQLSSVRVCSIAGEALTHSLYQALTDLFPQAQLFNDFGSTETNLLFFHEIHPPQHESDTIPLGQPIPAAQIHVMNKQKEILPAYIPGYLTVSGPTLFLGYLTNASIVISEQNYTQQTEINAGDLVYYRPDGVFIHAGRGLDQIKVRGMRVNLTALQHNLASLFPNQELALLVHTTSHDEKQIILFIVSTSDALAIYRRISSYFPAHLVPSFVEVLSEIPKLPNGKLDRTTLLQQFSSALKQQLALTPTDQAIEQRLLYVIQQVTELPITLDIAKQASLAEVGVDSLLAIRCLKQINQHFHLSLTAKTLMHYPEFTSLVQYISQLLGIKFNRSSQPTQLITDLIGLKAALKQLPAAAITHASKILVTGATGFIGSFITAKLLAQQHMVSCIVRANNDQHAFQRVQEQLESFQLWQPEYAQQLTVFAGRIEEPHFGLSINSYTQLNQECGHIMHCAAQVNHVVGYASLRNANVLSLKQLFTFAALEQAKPITFASSIAVNKLSSGQLWRQESLVPTGDEVISAYGKTKWLAEMLLVEYAEQFNVPVTIFRLGEVGASTQGFGRKDDIVHNLLFLLKQSEYQSDWSSYKVDLLPVDWVAELFTYTLQQPAQYDHPYQIYHCTHDAPIPLNQVIDLLSNKQQKSISIEAWLENIQQQLPQFDSELVPGIDLFLESSTNSAFSSYFSVLSLYQRQFHEFLEKHQITIPRLDQDYWRNIKLHWHTQE